MSADRRTGSQGGEVSLMLLLLVSACTVSDSGTKPDSGASADSADSGGGDTAPACATVTSGDDWAWSGACPQMTTPVAITVDGCAMTLDYGTGGMTMGMPYSGTIDGDTVTFANDDSVRGCVGTVVSADEISGTCKNGNCDFELKR